MKLVSTKKSMILLAPIFTIIKTSHGRSSTPFDLIGHTFDVLNLEQTLCQRSVSKMLLPAKIYTNLSATCPHHDTGPQPLVPTVTPGQSILSVSSFLRLIPIDHFTCSPFSACRILLDFAMNALKRPSMQSRKSTYCINLTFFVGFYAIAYYSRSLLY